MENQTKQLKVGDVIYAIGRSEITGRYVVDRVTKTQAICKISDRSDIRFRIDPYESGTVDPISRERWSITTYKLATPELDQQLKRQQLIRKIESTNFKQLTTDQLVQINSIIKQAENGNSN